MTWYDLLVWQVVRTSSYLHRIKSLTRPVLLDIGRRGSQTRHALSWTQVSYRPQFMHSLNQAGSSAAHRGQFTVASQQDVRLASTLDEFHCHGCKFGIDILPVVCQYGLHSIDGCNLSYSRLSRAIIETIFGVRIGLY